MKEEARQLKKHRREGEIHGMADRKESERRDRMKEYRMERKRMKEKRE